MTRPNGKQMHHTKYADLLYALREVMGLYKPLPDIVDPATVIESCANCLRYTGKGGRCPRHRAMAPGVL